MRVDQGDDQEEGLLLGRRRFEVLQHPLVTGDEVSVVVDEAAVVVGVAAAELVQVLVGPGVRRVPALEPVLIDVDRLPVIADHLAQMPFPLEGHVVANGAHDRRDVGQVERQRDLGIPLLGGHVFFEGVFHAVLGREVAAHERGAAGGAHAGVAERVLEGEAVLLQARQPLEVVLLPVLGEVHRLPLLVGDEDENVHPRDVALGRGRGFGFGLGLLGLGLQRGIGRGDDGERGGGLQEIASFHREMLLPNRTEPHWAAGERNGPRPRFQTGRTINNNSPPGAARTHPSPISSCRTPIDCIR